MLLMGFRESKLQVPTYRLDEQLHCHVIDALGGEDNVGACIEKHLNATLGDLDLSEMHRWSKK